MHLFQTNGNSRTQWRLRRRNGPGGAGAPRRRSRQALGLSQLKQVTRFSLKK